jgi:hypothetical protein
MTLHGPHLDLDLGIMPCHERRRCKATNMSDGEAKGKKKKKKIEKIHKKTENLK